MPLTNESADVLVVKQPDGNYLVRSKSEEGGIWLVNNIDHDSADYTGSALNVEKGCIGPFVKGMLRDGLVIDMQQQELLNEGDC